MFENINKIFKKQDKFSKIIYKPPKKPQSFKLLLSRISPKTLLKRFLRWLRLRDPISGELLVKEETDISKIIIHWNKIAITFLINITLSGILITIALFPFLSVELNFKIAIYVFSFGIGTYVITKIWNGIIKGFRSVANAIPKR